jgi:hypothetical protein
MKKQLILILAFLFAGFAFQPVIAAANYSPETALEDDFQKKKKKKKKKKKASSKKEDKAEKEKEAYSFKEHLWYGAGVGLGFSSFNSTSSFGIGLSPMVGYKILKSVSVGPRVSMFYTSQKYPGFKATNLIDTEVGVFTRVHVYNGFFLQGELSRSWDQEPIDIDPVNRRLIKQTTPRFNQYAGIGYNFSRGTGGPGQEISLMYNFRVANDTDPTNYEQPIQYRIAFTLGF